MADALDYGDYLAGLNPGPRCGCLDVRNLGESKWAIETVDYAIGSRPTGPALNADAFDAAMAWAFNEWAKVCGLKFRRVESLRQCNILIGAARGSRNNFDGPSGVLAWCGLPNGNNFRGQVPLMFDIDEDWESQIRVRNVACHEIGHGIGLSHNNVKSQLMNPIYSRSIASPQAYDISEIQTLYGKPVATNPTPTPPSPSAPVGAPKAVKVLGSDGRIWGASRFVEIPANALMEGDQWVF